VIHNETEFYRRVKWFAKKNGTSISSVEEQIGACNGYLRKLRSPDFYTIRRCAKVFGLTTDEFMDMRVGDVQTIKKITVFETDFTEAEWKTILKLVVMSEDAELKVGESIG